MTFKLEYLASLVDPIDGTALHVGVNSLLSTTGKSYPVVMGVPRFVTSENYASDFGLQWNRFQKNQLDSSTGHNYSEARLSRCLHCSDLNMLSGKTILEAGCGAGRFTEIMLKYRANLHSFDYSNAVEACFRNHGIKENFLLVQADIRSMPFKKATYDYVVCLGVVQHTPNSEETIRLLYEMVKPGGYLCFDHYIWKFRNILPPPIGVAENVYRQIILKLPKAKRLSAVKSIVDYFFPIHWRFRDSKIAQQLLRRISPVHFYYPDFTLRDYDEYYQWALLDTHDGTTDYYRHLITPGKVQQILQKLGAANIKVSVGGNGVEALCTKPELL